MVTKFVRSLRKKGRLEEILWGELSSMPGILLVVTDSTFALAWANDYFYEYFNCSPDDAVGKAMHGFLGEDIRGDMNKEHIRRVLEEGSIFGHLARTTGADGEFVTIKWNQRAFPKDSEQWILSMGFPPDIIGKKSGLSDVPTKDKDSRPSPMMSTGMEWSDFQSHGAYRALEEHLVVEDMELGRWISRENFLLHYQPRVNARTKAIVGAEGLVRMNHPECGLLFPKTFLPSLEKTGHILEVGSYVVETACRKLQEWRNNGDGYTLSVSINISPQQFCKEDFAQTLLAATARYRVEPGRLMLEMSERAIAANFQDAKQTLKILKDAGFKVAIDDYNTSFLPLAYLAQLVVDDITIDRAYLARADHDPTVYPVMESLILLAHSLNMTVTARGVENRRQLDFLLDNSVNFLQGYLISEPLPEAEFDRFLRTNPDFYTRHI